jgi:hypothetical protein
VWTGEGKQFFKHFGMQEISPCPRDDILAMCAGRIETILALHAMKGYPHLIARYQQGMRGWSDKLFEEGKEK